MKNLVLSLALVLGFLFFANESTIAQKATKAPKPVITGNVASLANILTEQDVALDVKTAEGLVEKGQSLVVVSGKGKKAKVYFIMNADGSMANKRIAKMADKELEVFGRLSVRNGLNVVIADKFQEKAPAPAKK
jgi:hypothetical protein